MTDDLIPRAEVLKAARRAQMRAEVISPSAARALGQLVEVLADLSPVDARFFDVVWVGPAPKDPLGCLCVKDEAGEIVSLGEDVSGEHNGGPALRFCTLPTGQGEGRLPSVTAAVAFLDEAARYFESRPTQGEDKAHWSNVANAEMCRKVAGLVQLLQEVDPYLDAIVCYASTMDEHKGNAVAAKLRAALNKGD